MKPRMAFLRCKRAKGREYWYFDTGHREKGKPVLTRLPHVDDPSFWDCYARAKAARTRRADRQNCMAFDDLVRRYQKSPEFRGLTENSKRSYTLHLAKANKLLRDRNGNSPPAESLERRDVTRIRDALADTPATASQTVRSLSALYTWAIDPAQGYATTNPAKNIKVFRGGEHQPWPEDLLEEALADPKVQLPVALLYFTGQRIGDVVRMQWNDVDQIRGEIAVSVQKTKTRMRISIIAELAERLKSAPRGDAMTILLGANGRPTTASAVRQKLQAWAVTVGKRKIVPHGLRKNAVNALFEAGCTEAEVSAITGHSLEMLAHYGKGRNQSRIGRAAILKFEDARSRRNGTGK